MPPGLRSSAGGDTANSAAAGALRAVKRVALAEVHDAGRDQRKLLAGHAGRRLVSWRAVPGLPAEHLFAMPAHEGEIKRPPGESHHRHPEQLLLEEELEQAECGALSRCWSTRMSAQVWWLQLTRYQPRRMRARRYPGRPRSVVLGQRHPATIADDPGFGNRGRESDRGADERPGNGRISLSIATSSRIGTQNRAVEPEQE
jgi:hypothetical protein